MPGTFRNKYRIDSHRLKGWDYNRNGLYFITFVTQHRQCNLGHIIHPNPSISGHTYLEPSDYGKIVWDEWIISFEIRHELYLDEWIMMPNHIHAIIGLENNATEMNDNETTNNGSIAVQTHGRASLQSKSPYRLPQSISSFIGGFKSSVNTKIDDYIDLHHLNIPKYNRNNHFFQPNYHDHIIRNNAEYVRIKNYIINNPLNWDNDSLK